MEKNQRKILSVGGSIIIPKTGFDISFLKKFRRLILNRVKKGDTFILIIGGGATCRQYQAAAANVVNLSNVDLDWIGIHATVFNAEFVRYLFKDVAYEHVVRNPNEKIKTTKPIIIGAGFEPGCSTDTDAVLFAKTYGAKNVYNLSNIRTVYTKDPNKFPDAKAIENMGWEQFRKEIVGEKWTAGANTPFDPTASALAHKLGLQVFFVEGTNLKEVGKAMAGKKFQGTVIG